MKPEKSIRAKRNMRYRKNRQKRIVEAKKSAKQTTHESESNRSLETKQQERETPPLMDITRDEPHMGNDRLRAVE